MYTHIYMYIYIYKTPTGRDTGAPTFIVGPLCMHLGICGPFASLVYLHFWSMCMFGPLVKWEATTGAVE